MHTSFPWNHQPNSHNPYAAHHHHHANQNNKDNSYVFDANLGPVNGLREQICSTVLQWEESSSEHNHHSSGASVGGSSSGASFKGLRRKVESSWKRWNQHSASHKPSRHSHYNHQLSTKFYLGYKRRTPDQDHAPAVADLQLFYVRLPRETLTKPPSQNATIIDPLPTTPPGSSAGLAGRVAAAAGHVLFRSHTEVETASSQNGSSTLESHHQQEDFQKIDLEEALAVPEGFDRWSFPEAFKIVYVPKPQKQEAPTTLHQSTKRSDKLREKTVLVASPSHRQRRNRRPQSPIGDNFDSLPPPIGSMHSTTDEAVEAYVQGSFSAPNSPNPQGNDPTSATGDVDDGQNSSTNNSEEMEFIPKLFTDVPWDEDHDDAPHHPFYHAEDQWWYVPIMALRQQRAGEEERYHEDPGIVDLAVSFCDKAGTAVLPQEQDDYSDDIMMEDDDEEFSLLSKTSWLVGRNGDNSALGDDHGKGPAARHSNSKKKKAVKAVKKALGSPAILLKRNIPIGFGDLAFATSVLDRFPLKNYKGLPLPEEELPMFCYPTGELL